MDADVYILEGQEKGGSHYLPTAFRCDVLLECHHIGKRLDWDQIHSWKKRGQRIPKGCLKQEGNAEPQCLTLPPTPRPGTPKRATGHSPTIRLDTGINLAATCSL